MAKERIPGLELRNVEKFVLRDPENGFFFEKTRCTSPTLGVPAVHEILDTSDIMKAAIFETFIQAQTALTLLIQEFDNDARKMHEFVNRKDKNSKEYRDRLMLLGTVLSDARRADLMEIVPVSITYHYAK